MSDVRSSFMFPWDECRPLAGSTVLITGGAGFIGSNLAAVLAAHDVRIRVLDNLYSGYRENLADLGDAVTLIPGDVREKDACARAMDGVDAVAHLAAEISVPRSVKEPALSHDINMNGGLNVLMAARDAGVKSLVLASSSAVYGENEVSPKHEGLLPEPLSPYASHKMAMEYYLANFAGLYGMKTVSLRFFNVFGPNQDPSSAYAAVIPLFAGRMLAGRAPTIFGDGEQTRDFVFVGDVVQALVRGLTAPGEAAGRCFNVGMGQSLSVNELFGTMARLTGFPGGPDYQPPRLGDVKHSRADISRARRELGFAPRFNFEQGLELALAWYRDHLDHQGKRRDIRREA